MTTIYEIPLTGAPQQFSLSVPRQGTNQMVTYQVTFSYRNNPMAGWVLDIADSVGNPLVCGIPLVTGTDLLGQYAYLNLGGHMVAYSEAIADAVPTYDNLGTGSHVKWITIP